MRLLLLPFVKRKKIFYFCLLLILALIIIMKKIIIKALFEEDNIFSASPNLTYLLTYLLTIGPHKHGKTQILFTNRQYIHI